jgi:pimeloyl-ACP methyl ester carboxylesterase
MLLMISREWLGLMFCCQASFGMSRASVVFALAWLNSDGCTREFGVKASAGWLATTDAEFSAGAGKSGCAHLTYYTVEYREWGDGPPLVLVPGLAGGFGLLGPLARLLARHFRVISYQLRGEDDCFALRRHFDLADLVGDLREFLDWYGLESPALFGVSFGGILALEFAARYPARLSNLLLQGVGARYERGLLPRVAGTVLARFPLPADNPFINQFFNLLFGGRQEQGPLFEFVTRQCWQTDQSIMAYRLRLVEQFNMDCRLRKIRVPTLVLAAERDLLVSEGSLQALCAGIRECSLVPLRACGHLAFVTHAEQVATAVKRFLHP